MIKELRRRYPVPVLCEVLEISGSEYNGWEERLPSKQQQDEARLQLEVLAATAHKRTRETYSTERLHDSLKDHVIKISKYPFT